MSTEVSVPLGIAPANGTVAAGNPWTYVQKLRFNFSGDLSIVGISVTFRSINITTRTWRGWCVIYDSVGNVHTVNYQTVQPGSNDALMQLYFPTPYPVVSGADYYIGVYTDVSSDGIIHPSVASTSPDGSSNPSTPSGYVSVYYEKLYRFSSTWASREVVTDANTQSLVGTINMLHDAGGNIKTYQSGTWVDAAKNIRESNVWKDAGAVVDL